jgi:pyruvate/2-oxoglutarate dehydrogenase complex dihydrolipoamide acyltransferase (E2) component
MHSTPNPKQTDPRDILLVAPEDKELSNLAHDAMRYSSDPQTRMGSDFSAGPPIPPVDMTFRPAAVNNVKVPGDRPSIGRRAVRAFTGFLLTVCIGGAGVAWQFYGDAAKRTIASWAPQLVLTSSPPRENPGPPEQPSPPTVQAADADAAPPQPAAPAQTAPEGVAPTAAALSPDLAQLLQSMARDLASVGQEIEQLKASIEQLKASQQQISRDVAKASEQNLRPRMSAPPPHSAAAPHVFDRAQHPQQLSPGTIP